MQKIKKGDTVTILTGKDKERTGKVEKVLPDKNQIFVGGINLVKRHVKGREGVAGGVIDIIKPINISNVALVCPKCKKGRRIGFEIKNGEKIRICRKCGEQV